MGNASCVVLGALAPSRQDRNTFTHCFILLRPAGASSAAGASFVVSDLSVAATGASSFSFFPPKSGSQEGFSIPRSFKKPKQLKLRSVQGRRCFGRSRYKAVCNSGNDKDKEEIKHNSHLGSTVNVRWFSSEKADFVK